MNSILVVGAGVFGLTAAIELNRRGYEVQVVDSGPIPHPLAASTDISKVVRMEYGADSLYMEMMEHAIEGWRRWNERFETTLYHETGVTMLTRAEMAPGGFEHDSYDTLLNRRHGPQRLRKMDIARRFPAWSSAYVDGFYHATGGFAESGKVVKSLAGYARTLGVNVIPDHKVDDLIETQEGVVGARTKEGDDLTADHTLVASGAWSSLLVPSASTLLRVTGHPVFHLRPEQPEYFTPPLFATFTADVARTGWYGFPLHPEEGVVKVANHGVGLEQHPDAPRVVTAEDEERLRSFLAESLPGLLSAPVVYTRRCLYCDTPDGDFLITQVPGTKGVSLATGGSGHGFKFAPVLGPLIADMVEGRPNPWLERFGWRSVPVEGTGAEAARHQG